MTKKYDGPERSAMASVKFIVTFDRQACGCGGPVGVAGQLFSSLGSKLKA